MRYLILSVLLITSYIASAQLEWESKSSMPNFGRNHAVCLSINGKIYVGLGSTYTGAYTNDFWEYDPATDLWTKMANFPGGARESCTYFSVKGKGYVGMGRTGSGTNYNDLYEYSPGSNSWTKKANFPGSKRYFASSFVIDSTAFIGSGSCGGPTCYYNDFWMYEPGANKWTQRASYPVTKSIAFCGISYGGYGYFGNPTAVGGTPSNDFYRYDKSANKWAKIATMPGSKRRLTSAFVLDTLIYVGCGAKSGFPVSVFQNDFYAYNPKTNTWKNYTSSSNFQPRVDHILTSIGDTSVYCVTGNDTNGKIAGLWKLITKKDTCVAYDTTFVSDTTFVNDTTLINVYDTSIFAIFDTTFVVIFDTTYIDVYVVDTLYKTIFDTIIHYDTLTIYDTLVSIRYDTIVVYDTVWTSIAVTDTLIVNLKNVGGCQSVRIQVYPNPSAEFVYVYSSRYSCLAGAEVTLVTQLGQTVRKQKIQSAITPIDLRGLARTIYILRVKNKSGNQILAKKILVK